MPLGLIKQRSIAFPGIFVTVCFLILFLLPKQTIARKKKLNKKRKYKNGPKASPTFYIFHRSFLTILLVLLFNKTKQPKNTSMDHNCIESSNFFQ